MSQTVTFAELVNLAIGTPELGNVNFNALHFLLHSMLQYFKLQDVPKEISEDELDFIKPSFKSVGSGAPSEPETPVRKSSSIFHQLHERVLALEKQLLFLNDTPTTAELLARTQVGIPAQPTQDMWQLMQLKKKMEVNEEGMCKAMNTLQDLLKNICELQITTETFKEELGQMKSDFQRLSIHKMHEQLKQLGSQAKVMEEIQQQMLQGHIKAVSMPDLSDMVRWSSLCDLLLGKSFPETEQEARDRLSRERLVSLGELPGRHKELVAQIAQLEGQLKQQTEQLERYETSAEERMELTSLLDRVNTLETRDHQVMRESQGWARGRALSSCACFLQRKESLKGILDQMPTLTKQYEKLEGAVGKLKRNSIDFQNIQNMLEQLDITKADKALIQEEMQVKADKSALEAKVNQVELSSATTQLNEMMQDLLQRMSLQDKDWQKALEKLFTDMDHKLDRMALDPLSQQLEEVWQFIKKYLSEGPRFDADSAAGFKRQLLERVKCLSCDRPVTLMTGPHLVTIRKAPLRLRPASANGYEYLAQKQKRGSETNEVPSSQPPQTCWQCQAHHQTCTIKRMSRSRDFATLYPYGDPTVLTYDNAEVDILGINGVLYKGRVNAQTVERTIAVQKDFIGVKPSRSPSGLRMERARSAVADFTYVSPFASSAVRRSRSATGSQRLPPPESLDKLVLGNCSFSQHSLQKGGGVTGL
ncbi:uncharacterized protein C16orf96 homolog [Heteronotia binoei]|uniref:uncharacterized protein C16orf96 homolog n=1 Tax=Heteronotia binoei TaxID=13085 RepID=UPI00292FB970|nr:uncharacterized protein C16orf96 homolog [Heteronotia binoei]